MNRITRKELRRRQSTQQLMGIDRLTDYSVKTLRGELVFFLIRPDNLSVLPGEGISGRVRALMELLCSLDAVTLRAMDSRESYEQNKIYYQQRMEEESDPAIRALLRQDRANLDEIQTMTASAREFAVVCRMPHQSGENAAVQLGQMEKEIRDRGFHVRLAREQDLKRLLAVYYQQDMTSEYFVSVDGERAVSGHAE